MKVPLLDLRLQYQTIKKEIAASLDKILESQHFILGPNVSQLEQEMAKFCGTNFAIGVSSGSDALLIAMMAAGITPGDKVVTTPYTFFSTAGSICRLGATPVFVDIDAKTYNIDPNKVAELLYSFTTAEVQQVKAIVPVHLFGQCAAMEPIINLAAKFQLKIIEDGAQALGSSYTLHSQEKMACGMGDFGCTSFFPSKNLGGFGDGGMITTNHEALAKKISCLRVHGQVERYNHKFIGINGRLDAIQAVVLLTKLPYLSQWIEKRQQNAQYYERLFREANLTEHITLPYTQPGSNHVFNQFIIRSPRRDELQEYLTRQGIGCAIYYPLPLHLQECYGFLKYKSGDFPESEKAAQETLALPIFPELTREQQEYVVAQIRNFCNMF